jgi:natural product biosynthesis luciferase-like monooxygenase protein
MLQCLLIGDESLLAQCGDLLKDRGHGIAAVISGNPVIRRWASAQSIPALEWGADLSATLDGIEYDWLFSIANLRMLPEAVWKKARLGAMNFHDGPLPHFAGLNTPSWAILEGATTHGVTWHAITAGADEGDIYAQALFDIAPDETGFTLNSRCFEAGIATFAEVLEQIGSDTLAPRRQDLSQRTYYGRDRRPTAAGTLRFDRPAEELSKLWRALDFGPGYANPLVTPKLLTARGLFHLTSFEVEESGLHLVANPGTVLAVEAGGVLVATVDRAVRVDGVLYTDGKTLLRESVAAGEVLPLPDADALDAAVSTVVRHEAPMAQAVRCAQNPALFDVKDVPAAAADFASVVLSVPQGLSNDAAVTAFLVFLSRFSTQEEIAVAYRGPNARDLSSRFPSYFAESAPLLANIVGEQPVAALLGEVSARLDRLRRNGTYLTDLSRRLPDFQEPRLSFGIIEGDEIGDTVALANCALYLHLADGNEARLHFDRNRISEGMAARYSYRIATLAAGLASGAGPVGELPAMSADEADLVLLGWNDTDRPYDGSICVHRLIEQQVDRTPHAVALAVRGEVITYAELDARANRIAHALIDMGVRADTMVGLNLPRSFDLVVGALAIQKAGGAYVPLDPHFPADRLVHMVEDSGAPLILASRAMTNALTAESARTVFVEDILSATVPDTRPDVAVLPENLAYVIYTSGSTGLPKGVMIEHRNVVNFFAGMDERVEHGGESQPVWLAVTSLSFDISVLELFWTLARGFKVVIHTAETKEHKNAAVRSSTRSAASGKPLDFGLFYWGNDDGAGSAKYNLLLEGAKFADDNGFQAIWTPERHFHAFGGPYPNPAVTGAAVAAVTKNLSIRAGSCVLPLHHPARVAEEWAVLDNLSNGRVAIAFASGWMPEDFVLRPENAPPHNKQAMINDIDTVRRLWRGERVSFDFGAGKADIVTQPRPVQPELPVWLTTAGNPETYREAARLGANVLTHLLGQSVDELADKIRIYRETLVECGRDPRDYKITLMLHTLLGEDRDEVRERARGPMKDYLRSAAALIKQYAWAFPAFKKPQGAASAMDIDLQSLAPDEMDAILEFAFLRYFDDSGLFGTVEDAMRRIEQIAAIGVDEVACLIDFGVPSATVLERLKPLAEVVAKARSVPDEVSREPAGETGFAADVRRHGVTHMQCTPSMVRMFLTDDADRVSLATVRHLYIGGEALPASLLGDIRSATTASVENMYGPTETTIWSSTARAEHCDTVVPLGRPIANTQFYVLDPAGRVAAPGQPGELHIGGDGVARGYLNRQELTAERFLPNPFARGRIYRTGDLVCFTDEGVLRFLGRTDYQVKVRGYRIELGEIEARIAGFPGVAETVVMAREDREGDVRLVAYVRLVTGSLDEDALRRDLSEVLPDYMVPAHFVVLDIFPLTPNAKVDRKALPKPEGRIAAVSGEIYVAPEDNAQKEIAEAFRRTLGLERVGVNDNFFALGGHSLLAVQLHRDLKAGPAPELTVTDIFRFPTVGALAAHIAGRGVTNERLSQVADRAAMRRAALGDRRSAMLRGRS